MGNFNFDFYTCGQKLIEMAYSSNCLGFWLFIWTMDTISKHQNFLKDLNLISANVPVSHILSDAVFPAVLIGMLFLGGAIAAL